MRGVAPRCVQHACGCVARKMQARSSGTESCVRQHMQQQRGRQCECVRCRPEKQPAGGHMEPSLPVARVYVRYAGVVTHWPGADEQSASYVCTSGQHASWWYDGGMLYRGPVAGPSVAQCLGWLAGRGSQCRSLQTAVPDTVGPTHAAPATAAFIVLVCHRHSVSRNEQYWQPGHCSPMPPASSRRALRSRACRPTLPIFPVLGGAGVCSSSPVLLYYWYADHPAPNGTVLQE
jgi:hypothetical protein